MAFRRMALIAFLVSGVLSLTVQAQTDPIAWHPSLDAAKAEAKQTGRLVLVHFWTEDCAPCVALERNVFSQPEVANALKAQFVPVKLNANANPATASAMGVTRVPTDVVITPDGQLVGKLVSPATPMAYMAELTQMASKFNGQPGQAMDSAIASASQPSQLNSAATAPQSPQVNSVYAGLQLGSAAAPALSTPTLPPAGDRYASSAPFAAPPNLNQPARTAATTAGSTPSMNPAMTPQGQTVQPSPTMIENRYGQPATNAPPSAGQAMSNQFSMPPQSPAAAVVPSAPANALVSQTTAPDARRLPAGAPQLGFEGFCPVSMRSEWRWVAGNPQFGAIHRGRTYWFATAAHQQQFLANPDFFSPALSGIDPVLAVDHRQQVPGRREHSIDYDNLFYMFASEASLQQFTANPERYAASVRAAMGIQRGRSVR